MMYLKFPKRYLATIVFCLILTLGALGVIFLIYLFNEGRSALVFTVGEVTTNGDRIAKSMVQGQQQSKHNVILHQHQHIAMQSTDKNEINYRQIQLQQQQKSDGNDDLDDNSDDDDDSDIGRNHYTMNGNRQQLPQQQQRLANNMKYKWQGTVPAVDSGETFTNEEQEENQSQQQILDNNISTAEYVDKFDLNTGFTKRLIYDDKDDDDISISVASSSEIILKQPQLHNQKQQSTQPHITDRDNFDTIYIDDYERPKSNNIQLDNSHHYREDNRRQKSSFQPAEVVASEHISTDISDINYFDVDDDGSNHQSNHNSKTSNHEKSIQFNPHVATTTKATTFTSQKTTSSSVSASSIIAMKLSKRNKQRNQNKKQVTEHQKQHLIIRMPNINGVTATTTHLQSRQTLASKSLQQHYKQLDNLDTLYDNNNNYDIVSDDEGDDDDNDFATASGSGDFGTISRNNKNELGARQLNDDVNNGGEENFVVVAAVFNDDINDTPTNNFIKRISFKMVQMQDSKSHNKTSSNIQSGRKPKILKKLKAKNRFMHKRQQQLQSLKKKKSKHTAHMWRSKVANSSNNNNNTKEEQHIKVLKISNIIDKFYNLSSDIVTNLSARQVFPNEHKHFHSKSMIPASTNTTEVMLMEVDSNQTNSNNSEHFQTASNAERKLLPTVSVSAPAIYARAITSDIIIPISTKNDRQSQLGADIMQQPKQIIADINIAPATDISVTGGAVSSAAWLETRTRRIIGNIKKSEERSRQLLLCEEAGGGELCRMLFKGHLNE